MKRRSGMGEALRALACALLISSALPAGAEEALSDLARQVQAQRQQLFERVVLQASARIESGEVEGAQLAETLRNRAVARNYMLQYAEALQDFSRAIEMNPRHAPAYIARANLLRSQNDLSAAMADLDQAIRLNPENAQSFHARGLIHQRNGDHARAVSDFENAIDRDPFVAAPYQARGQSLVVLGRHDAAIEDFNAALNVNNQNSDAWAGLGLAYERKGDRAKAAESYGRALVVNPGNQLARDGQSRVGRG